MDTVVQQGKARYIGVSQYQAWQVMRALGIQERSNAAPLITVQNPYSLLDRRLEVEMFLLVRALDVRVASEDMQRLNDLYFVDSMRRFPGRFAALGYLEDPLAPDAPAKLRRQYDEDHFRGVRLHLIFPQVNAGVLAGAADSLFQELTADEQECILGRTALSLWVMA